MVNMAISLDPLSANKMMPVDPAALQKQKNAIEPLVEELTA